MVLPIPEGDLEWQQQHLPCQENKMHEGVYERS